MMHGHRNLKPKNHYSSLVTNKREREIVEHATKGKAVPTHTTKVHGMSKGTDPLIPNPSMSGNTHTPFPLPPTKEPQISQTGGWLGPRLVSCS